MRLRSSEGWNEKSKPDSVLMVASRAICSAALIRRLSRMVISSASSVSIASIALIWPRSSCWTTCVQRLQRARHAQADQVIAGCARSARLELGRPHAAAPFAARRLPTAS